jgi:RNA polymerase sigma factor (sigma-70 family)
VDDPRGAGLLAAVRELSPDARAVVAMRYWVDLGHEEIAETLGVAVGTVRSRLSRALVDLRRVMEVVDRG